MQNFNQYVSRYKGNYKVRSFKCLEQFFCVAFAQITYREKKRLELEQSLYTTLQILSLILIKRIPILQAFRQVGYKTEKGDSGNQLLLFN